MSRKRPVAIRTFILFSSLHLLCSSLVSAQSIPVDTADVDTAGVDTLPQKRSVWRLGGGTGLLVPLGFAHTLYWQAGINAQLGATHEYYWRRRISLLAGAEYRLQTLVADARFVPIGRADESHKRIIAQPAPDSVKYASLRYQMISVPVMLRYYFARNAVRRLFVDVGASFNFPVAVASRYRTNGLTHRDKITSFVESPIVLIEVSAGANGQVFGGRLTKANNLLGALLFGAFLGIDSSVRTSRNQTVTTVGFLTKFVF